MLLYHGSDSAVEHPEIRATTRFLDFGTGFYTTSSRDQAERWATRVRIRNNSRDEIISAYEFNHDEARHNPSA